MTEATTRRSGSEAAPHPKGAAPSMLDLVRLSRRPMFPPGGHALYRQIALLTAMEPDQKVVDVACGSGVTLRYFVEEFDVQGFGVDIDARVIEEAEARTRAAELQGRLQFQQSPLDRLPYRDEIFDVVVGELGLAAHADPEDAVRELVRITRPGGRIVLIQLVWKAPVDTERQRVLVGHLGARPLMLVEWKKLLRQAGVGHLHTEAWSDEETAFRPRVKKPFPDFAELFSLPEKIGILRRAWSRWGWRGVRTAVAREMEVHRLLTKERILGLDLVIGRKDDPVEDHPGDDPVDESAEVPRDDSGEASGEVATDDSPEEAGRRDAARERPEAHVPDSDPDAGGR